MRREEEVISVREGNLFTDFRKEWYHIKRNQSRIREGRGGGLSHI